MTQYTSDSLERREGLITKVETIVNQYQTILADHLAKEAKIKAKRTKIKTQLTTIMGSYDIDMREKQDQFDEVMERYLNFMYSNKKHVDGTFSLVERKQKNI